MLSLALLVLLSKGVSVESKSDGLVTSDAELMNGRLAVLGLVAFAFTEYVKGGSLVLSQKSCTSCRSVFLLIHSYMED